MVPHVKRPRINGILDSFLWLHQTKVELVKFDMLGDLLLSEEPADDGRLDEFVEVL